MNGGDTNLSGPQVAPNSPTPPAPGPQPASSAGSRPVDSSPILSIPHSDKAPSKPLVIKVQAPTPQPDTPSPTPSVAASPAPSPSPSVPTPDTQVDHTPTASAAPQPITPTPAPTTISTETFSAPTPVATGTYYGANTGMPAQNYPSGYTNPATSPTMQTYVSQYPAGTDTYTKDDQQFIELADSTTKAQKSRKWWVIGGVVGVLAAIAIALMVVMPNKKTDNNTASLSFEHYKHYANYLIYGEDSGKDIAEDVEWDKQSVILDVILLYSSKEKADYADMLLDLYNNFSESFTKLDMDKEFKENKELVKGLYESTNTSVESLSRLIKSGNVSSDEIVSAYLKGGEKNVTDILNTAFGDIDSSNEDSYSSFVVSKKQEAGAIVALYNYYSSKGCIHNGNMNSDCIVLHSSDEGAIPLIESMNSTTEESNLLANHIIYDTLSYSDYLYTFLKEDNAEQEN